MDGYHGHAPNGGGYYQDNQNPLLSPDIFSGQQLSIQTQLNDNAYQYTELDDPTQLISPQESVKSKRRQSQGDHIKHKRTRSGCFTCRQRRVKCDEAHPICERCRKGGRDCVYPEQLNQRPPRDGSKAKTAQADSSSSGSDDEGDSHKNRLPSIVDEDLVIAGSSTAQHDSVSPSQRERGTSSTAEPSSKTQTKRPQPLRSTTKPSNPKFPALGGPKWVTLPKEVRYFIRYHRETLTCDHYALKFDNTNFLQTTFLEIALSYEPLLYAITAFAAYFHTLDRPDGKLQDFLQYYNKSVSLLRDSLAKSSRHSTATLLTILQLATFEEYLGDWVNVSNHQKAAYEIMTQLFTPETIMQNETRRKILGWYMRFDIVTGFVGGFEAVLGREWYESYMNYYARQRTERPDDVGCAVEDFFAEIKLIALDISLVFAQKARGSISMADFTAKLAQIKIDMTKRKEALLTLFEDKRKFITDFGNGKQPDLFGSSDPDYLLAEPLWTLNIVAIDWYGVELLFLGQAMQVDQTIDPMDLLALGRKICQLFEGFELASSNKRHGVLSAHSSVGIAMTTLPRDEAHKNWCRSTLGLIESCGYFHPTPFRKRISDLFAIDLESDPSWWDIDDEPRPAVLKHIREFIDYRAAHPNDAKTDSLRDLRGVFKAMNLDDDPHKHGAAEPRSAGSYTSLDQLMADTSSDLWTNPDENSPDLFAEAPSSAGSGAHDWLS